MSKRMVFVISMLAISASAATAGRAAEPSAKCTGAAAAPSARVSTLPILEATICNGGAPVPAPAKGAVTARVDTTARTGHVEVDGDSDNATRGCTDGFVRVGVDATGAHFYQSKDGSFTDTDPKKAGNQAATEEAPNAWAQSVQANCAA